MKKNRQSVGWQRVIARRRRSPASSQAESAARARFGARQRVTIDGAAVRRISSPCLQVLLAGMDAFAKAGGPPMKIVSPSAAFLETGFGPRSAGRSGDGWA